MKNLLEKYLEQEDRINQEIALDLMAEDESMRAIYFTDSDIQEQAYNLMIEKY